MGAVFQSIEQISFLVIFLVGIDFGLAQSNGRNSERNTGIQGSSYFFYQQPDYPKDCKDALYQCSTLNSSRVYLIKPTGYTDPFEVYCRNEDTSNGWTVIGRRLDGIISFNRNWNDFRNGFGFLSGEFWLGNDKLSFVTNQRVYELHIEMELSNGSFFHISYNSFRISDEWSQYAIVPIGSFDGDADNAVTYCPLNMIYGTCTCQLTCSNPYNRTSCINSCEETESCICADGFLKKEDKCVPSNACECFVAEINKVVPNGEAHNNIDCSVKYTCQNNRLNSDSSYRCSPNAQCVVKDGVGQCQCNEGFEGDDETCSPLYTDCYDAYQAGHREDGVYTILPSGWPDSPFNVSCVMSTNGGGWTVFQRRSDDVTEFYQNWDSYRYGFGSFSSNFWLGNEKLHYLTSQKNYTLRIDIVDSEGSPKYDEYESFRINNNGTKFRIDDLGSQSGNGGNGMRYTIGRSFSTYDQDNVGCENFKCAEKHRGAWWYTNEWCSACWTCATCCNDFQYSSSCRTQCSYSNLNGDFNGGFAETVFWADGGRNSDRYHYHCNVNFTEMKIRPT